MPRSACLPSSFLVTLFVLHWFQRASYPLPLWMIIGIVMIVGTVMWVQKQSHRLGQILILIVTGTSLALWSVSHVVGRDADIRRYADRGVIEIEGRITAAPDNWQNMVTYVMNAERVRLTATGAWIDTNGRIQVMDATAWPRHTYGSVMKVKGKLVAVPLDGEDFDDYLRMQGIDARIARSQRIDLITAGNRYAMTAVLTRLRDTVEARISLLYHEPEASLLKGLLTGSRQDMPDNLRTAFRTTGLTHIVAISGFNITIILTAIGSLLFFLPFRWKLIPSIVGITLFTLFVGASASVVRAAIMGGLGLLAMQSGRLSHVRLSILWTAFIMLLHNPLSLWYDAGFQLSFLAVMGLAELGKPLEPLLEKLPKTLGIRETLSATIAASMSAMPWAAFRFGTISLISPLANLIVVPMVPLAMFFGFAATVAGFVWAPLGQLVGIPAYLLLLLIIQSTTLLAQIPLAAFEWSDMHPLFIIMYYALLIGCLVYFGHKKTAG